MERSPATCLSRSRHNLDGLEAATRTAPCRASPALLQGSCREFLGQFLPSQSVKELAPLRPYILPNRVHLIGFAKVRPTNSTWSDVVIVTSGSVSEFGHECPQTGNRI